MRPAHPNRLFRAALAIDAWLGPPLCALLVLARQLGRRSPPPPEEPRRILVLKFWGLGSIVLASPLCREIQSRYPGARIDFVTLSQNVGLFEHLPHVDRAFSLDLQRGIPRFLAGTFRTLRQIRRERYDLLLDLEFFTHYSALFSASAGAAYTCGFSARHGLRGRLHDTQIPFNEYNHVALNFLALLDRDPAEPIPALDLDESVLLPRLAIRSDTRESLAAKLSTHEDWREDRPLVVVNPNAGDLALERRWPPARATVFLERLAASCDANIAVTGAPAERDFVTSLIAAAGVAERVVNLAGELELGEFAALLARADVVVTNDSGPLHLAAAAGTSTVALFGPETPVLYGPLRSRDGQRHRVHYRRLVCSPCINVHENKMLSCWFAEAACMQGIEPESILRSTLDLLQRSSGTTPYGRVGDGTAAGRSA